MTELWNKAADNLKQEYFGSITCDSFTVGTTQIQLEQYDCSLLTDPARIVVDGGFKQADIPENTTISININGFKNPIQANTSYSIFNVFTSGQNEEDLVD